MERNRLFMLARQPVKIIAPVTVRNAFDTSKSLRCDALVDTGASFTILPKAWKDHLGKFEASSEVELQTATQETVKGVLCGPVKITVEGFRPIYNEVLFVDMKHHEGSYEPLIGYLVLEQCQAAVDMLGHRLVHVKYLDLK